MNIQRTGILASPLKTNFKAQTKITAPEELLCPEDIDYFEKLGSRIGTDKDVIEITIDDAVAADEVFSELMGEEVAPRREFIEENATYAKIDV